MPDETLATGPSRPTTPNINGLALTEYTAAPTPPTHEAAQRRASGLPPNWGLSDAFLLPNGYPDVSGCGLAIDHRLTLVYSISVSF